MVILMIDAFKGVFLFDEKSLFCTNKHTHTKGFWSSRLILSRVSVVSPSQERFLKNGYSSLKNL